MDGVLVGDRLDYSVLNSAVKVL